MADETTAGETAPNAQEEMVSIEEASLEDLDAFLEKNVGNSDEESDDEDTSEELALDTEPEEEPEEETQKGDEKDAKIKDLELKYEELKRRRQVERQQRETYIRRLKDQLGARRQSTLAEIETRRKALSSDKFLDDPLTAVDQRLQLKEVEDQLKSIEAEEQAADYAIRNQEIFEHHVDPEEISVDDMAATLARDGVDPLVIQQFRQQPFMAADGQVLVHLARRAKAEKLLIQVTEFAKQLQTRVQQLEGKPKQVLEKVSKQLKVPPRMGAGATSSPRTSFSDRDISEMSDDELKSLEKKLLKSIERTNG